MDPIDFSHYLGVFILEILTGKFVSNDWVFSYLLYFMIFFMTYLFIIGCCKMRGLQPIRIEGIPF